MKIAKIDITKKCMGKMLNSHLLIILYSGLLSSRKYFRYFYSYSPMTKINSTKSIILVVVGVALIAEKNNSNKFFHIY